MKILNKYCDGKLKDVSLKKSKKQHVSKDKANLRKKLLRVLKSKEVYSSGLESDEDYSLCAVENNTGKNGGLKSQTNGESQVKVKKKLNKIGETDQKSKNMVKIKETSQEEREMVNVISNILSTKSKTLLKRISDVVDTSKLRKKADDATNGRPINLKDKVSEKEVLKRKSKSNKVKIKQLSVEEPSLATNISSRKSKKILKNLTDVDEHKQKMNVKENFNDASNLLRVNENDACDDMFNEIVMEKKMKKLRSNNAFFSNNYNLKKEKLYQNTNYANTVLEIFDSKIPKSVVIKTLNFRLDFSKDFERDKKKRKASPDKEVLPVMASDSNLDLDDGMIRNDKKKRKLSKEFPDEEVSEKSIDVDDSPIDSLCLENLSKNVTENINSNLESTRHSMKAQPSKYMLFTFQSCCILVMKQNTTVYFCGKLKATLLRGSVDILGHKMDSVARDVYSPPLASLLYFHSYHHSDINLDESQLYNLQISADECNQVLNNIGATDSVLLLQPLVNTMTEFVNKHFSYFNVFTKDKVEEIENVEAFKLLQCHFFSNPRKGVLQLNLISSSISKQILSAANISDRNVTMICGGKNSGKSTFLRYLVNQCLIKGPVLVLDLDPGQPEFTVCGLLSATVVMEPLLGPNFTHLRNPDRSLTLGFISISENENRYMECVQDLYKYCSAHGKYNNMPWIVNTSGFTGPIGLKLLAFAMNIYNPKMVVELINGVKRLNHDFRLTSENINEYQKTVNFGFNGDCVAIVNHDYKYYDLDPYNYLWTSSKPSICRNVEAKDERMLNVLAYFSQISNSDMSILEEPPYVISMDDISLFFNCLSVDEKYMYSITNSKMVALCHNDDLDNDLKLFSCYGYGIIRGIDFCQKKIYVTTPVKPSLISFVNTLTYGESLPDCSFVAIASLPAGTFVPYAMPFVNTHVNKQLMRTPKRKFNPFRLMDIRNKAM